MNRDGLTSSEPSRGALLDVRGLVVEFDVGHGQPPFRAVDDVSLAVGPSETVGLVGESGSGKSTIGRAILGLTRPTAGSIALAGREISRATYRERRRLSSELQVVFQDPFSSLNPTRTIGQTLAEPLRLHAKVSSDETRKRVREVLGKVGLDAEAVDRYPAQFSGGQRQRIAIARALIVRPQIVICDEPVSALDLSVQAQVLNLLRDLQEEFGLSYLFISHDLEVVRNLCHRVVVLYRGRVMEQGDAGVVHADPVHPYTRALLEAAPVPDPEEQRRRRIARTSKASGSVDSSPAGRGCPFAHRCPLAIDVCRSDRPPLEATPDGTLVACHRWRSITHDEGPSIRRGSAQTTSTEMPRSSSSGPRLTITGGLGSR